MGRKSVSLALGLGFALVGVMTANAATTYETESLWNGITTISPFGNPNTSTYGQTFLAPVDPLMTDFSFHINASVATTLQFQGEVYQWSGPMQGNGGQATGAMLYQSAPTVLMGNGAFQTVTMTPNIMLTPGNQYVALLTISDPTNYAATIGTSIWALLFNTHGANNGGGGAVFYNNQNNHAALNSSTWDTFFDYGDMAWRANFTAGNVAVPEPGSVALLVGMGASGAGFLLRRKKK